MCQSSIKIPGGEVSFCEFRRHLSHHKHNLINRIKCAFIAFVAIGLLDAYCHSLDSCSCSTIDSRVCHGSPVFCVAVQIFA